MQVGCVRHDRLGRDWRLALILVPKKACALADLELIEHRLVRHRAPANRQIDRHKGGCVIVAIDFPMQDARIERKMSERLEVKFSIVESAVVRRGRTLMRFRRNQHPGGIGNGSVKARVNKPGNCQKSDGGERFQSRRGFVGAGSMRDDRSRESV